jgi:hypothetical protein
MKLASSDSRPGKESARAGGSGTTALLGAAATFVVLIGVAAIAASPRSLSDMAQLPASTESFEVAPAAAPEVTTDAFAFSHASGRYEDSGVPVSYDVETSA